MNRLTLDEAKRLGYCITSRRHLQASRLERPDWLEYMNAKMRTDWKRTPMSASWYRRCLSKDVIAMPSAWIGQLPNSDDPSAPKEFVLC